MFPEIPLGYIKEEGGYPTALPFPSFLAQLAAQMSSVSAKVKKIISIASEHQGHCHIAVDISWSLCRGF